MTTCWSCGDAPAQVIVEGSLVCPRCTPEAPLDIPDFCKASA